MTAFLKLIRTPYEEPYHLHLTIMASNGRQKSEIEFYLATRTLIDWAENLETFPKHANHVYLWEYGSERPEDKWAYYLRIRAVSIDALGHCALHFRFNNNAPIPEREISEFCIRAEAAAVNRLGTLFGGFAKLEHEALVWTTADGKLFKTAAEANLESEPTVQISDS